MKKKCTVRLTDIQIEDGERQAVEITTQGVYEWREDGYSLRFEEYFDEDVRSMTTIRSSRRGCVTVIHRGDITTELTVELGKRHAGDIADCLQQGGCASMDASTAMLLDEMRAAPNV